MIFNFSILALSKIVNAILFLIAVPILVHQLGFDGYGEYALFRVYSGLLLSIFSGVNSYALYVGASQNNGSHMIEAKWHNVFNHFMQSVAILSMAAIIVYASISLNLFATFSSLILSELFYNYWHMNPNTQTVYIFK